MVVLTCVSGLGVSHVNAIRGGGHMGGGRMGGSRSFEGHGRDLGGMHGRATERNWQGHRGHRGDWYNRGYNRSWHNGAWWGVGYSWYPLLWTTGIYLAWGFPAMAQAGQWDDIVDKLNNQIDDLQDQIDQLRAQNANQSQIQDLQNKIDTYEQDLQLAQEYRDNPPQS